MSEDNHNSVHSWWVVPIIAIVVALSCAVGELKDRVAALEALINP